MRQSKNGGRAFVTVPTQNSRKKCNYLQIESIENQQQRENCMDTHDSRYKETLYQAIVIPTPTLYISVSNVYTQHTELVCMFKLHGTHTLGLTPKMDTIPW